MATKTQCFHLVGMACWVDLVPPTKQSMSSKDNSMHFGHANIHRIYARLTHNQIHKEGKLNWTTHLLWLFIHSPQPPYSIWPIYESCILFTSLLTPYVIRLNLKLDDKSSFHVFSIILILSLEFLSMFLLNVVLKEKMGSLPFHEYALELLFKALPQNVKKHSLWAHCWFPPPQFVPLPIQYNANSLYYLLLHFQEVYAF